VRQVPSDVAGISSLLGRNVIIAELAKLPPRQRLVAWLVFFHELSTREIADELGIQPQAVRKLLRSAKANLIDRIAESQHQSLQ
jgi:RNA polymerase sigma factor (sigma-70 family)